MEGDFPSVFHDFPSIMDHSAEPRFINSGFPAFSSVNLEKTPVQSEEFSNGTYLLEFPSISMADPVALSYFNRDLMDFQQKQTFGCSIGGDQYLKSSSIDMEKSKLPKIEPIDDEWGSGTSNQQFITSSQYLMNHCNSTFHQLPDLHSLEQNSHHEEQTLKRLRSSSSTDSYTLDAIVRNVPQYNPRYLPSFKPLNPEPPSVISQSQIARQRRKTISDRIRSLQKLMPWDKKMDMATMLEEAYKYTKFLQAQVSVLQSMPCQSSLISTARDLEPISNVCGAFGGLEKLNRQQMLEVLVNSPIAQTILYSSECCVYSLEQVISLKKNLLLQQILSGSSRGV